MKLIVASLIVLSAVVSCTNAKQTTFAYTPLTISAVQPISTNTSIASISPAPVTQTPQYFGSLVPLVTASPIPFDASSEDMTKTIDTLFNKQTCTKEDYLKPIAPYISQGFLGYQVGKPEFIEVTNQVDFSKVFLEEIADNTRKNYRAYLVVEPQPTNSCPACIQLRVYVEDQETKQVYKINWKGYQPSRVISRLMWIGDKILTFFQSVGPHGDELIGIDVEKQAFIYYSSLSCY